MSVSLRFFLQFLLAFGTVGLAPAVTLFQGDNFNSGNTWQAGLGGSNVTRSATGGTSGLAGDGKLLIQGNNQGNDNSRVTFVNTTSTWTGNYTAAGVNRIAFNVRNPNPGAGGGGGGGPTPDGANVVLRLRLDGPGGQFNTVSSVSVLAGTTAWQTVWFDLIPSNLQSNGPTGTSLANTLANVSEVRISHAPDSFPWVEVGVNTLLEVDNITPTQIPEPSTLGLLALGLALSIRRRSR